MLVIDNLWATTADSSAHFDCEIKLFKKIKQTQNKKDEYKKMLTELMCGVIELSNRI